MGCDPHPDSGITIYRAQELHAPHTLVGPRLSRVRLARRRPSGAVAATVAADPAAAAACMRKHRQSRLQKANRQGVVNISYSFSCCLLTEQHTYCDKIRGLGSRSESGRSEDSELSILSTPRELLGTRFVWELHKRLKSSKKCELFLVQLLRNSGF
jgi:hypothetical protein